MLWWNRPFSAHGFISFRNFVITQFLHCFGGVMYPFWWGNLQQHIQVYVHHIICFFFGTQKETILFPTHHMFDFAWVVVLNLKRVWKLGDISAVLFASSMETLCKSSALKVSVSSSSSSVIFCQCLSVEFLLRWPLYLQS